MEAKGWWLWLKVGDEIQEEMRSFQLCDKSIHAWEVFVVER